LIAIRGTPTTLVNPSCSGKKMTTKHCSNGLAIYLFFPSHSVSSPLPSSSLSSAPPCHLASLLFPAPISESPIHSPVLALPRRCHMEVRSVRRHLLARLCANAATPNGYSRKTSSASRPLEEDELSVTPDSYSRKTSSAAASRHQEMSSSSSAAASHPSQRGRAPTFHLQ
jgi:hypothetical protein